MQAAVCAARRPGLPLSWLLGPVLGVAVTVALVVLVQPQRPVGRVEVEGAFRHLKPSAMQRADAETLAGAAWAMLPLKPVLSGFAAEPWVREAAVRRVWPDRLRVRVSERTPVAYWGVGALDDQGEPFYPGRVGDLGDLPVLAGPESEAGRLWRTYGNLAALLKPLGLSLTELRQQSRGALSVRSADGIEIRLGRDDWNIRLERLLALWPVALADRQQAVAAVDLRYGNGLAVLWRDEPSTSPEAQDKRPAAAAVPGAIDSTRQGG